MADLKQQALSWLDEHKMDMAQFLSDMVKIPSLNEGVADTCDEREMADFVTKEYEGMGLDVERLVFDKEGKRPNVAGTWRGTGGGKSILFNAHMDVVPIDAPDEWKYPHFGGVIEDNRVYGRGSSDDKMGIAAFTYAVKALQAAGVKLRGDVILLPSAGEESCEGGVYGPGPAVHELMKRENKPSAAVVAELSGMDILVESSSLLFFEVIVKGKACHVGNRAKCVFPQPWGIPSGSEVGVDALEHMLPIIEMFYRKERDWGLNTMRSAVLGAGDSMGVGQFTINPCYFSGGSYLGSLPAEARVTYGIWFDSGISKEDMMQEIRDSIDAVCRNDSWLRENPPEIRMPIIQDWPGYKVDKNSEFVKTAAKITGEVLGREAVVTGFNAACDCTWICNEGVPAITLGPGSSENRCHTIDEYCDIDELLQSAKVYASLMMEWCK